MGTLTLALTWIVALGIAGATLVYWWWVMRQGEDLARRAVERRFDVSIGRTSRGHWHVNGSGSWVRRIGLELLQLAYFLVAFVGWAVGTGLGVGILAGIQALGLDG